MPSTAERQRKGDLYWDLPEERLTRLTLTRGGETLEFERPEGRRWRMIKPDAYPADPFAVNGAAGELTDLKRAVRRLRRGEARRLRPREAGGVGEARLDRPRRADGAEDAHDRVRRRRPGYRHHRGARARARSKVLFVPSSALAAVRKPADDFRSRDVFDGLDLRRQPGRDPAGARPPRAHAPGRGVVAVRADRGPRRRRRVRPPGGPADGAAGRPSSCARARISPPFRSTRRSTGSASRARRAR